MNNITYMNRYALGPQFLNLLGGNAINRVMDANIMDNTIDDITVNDIIILKYMNVITITTR